MEITASFYYMRPRVRFRTAVCQFLKTENRKGDTMSVHLRERPAAQKPTRALRAGYPQRLMPGALRAAAAVLGCMGACAPVLGGMRPLGLCFAMSAPTPYALYTAAGARRQVNGPFIVRPYLA